MSPVWRCLLLLLLQGALPSECAETVTPPNIGQEFLMAFLESVAYYHPDTHNNSIHITCLHNDTTVSYSWPQVSGVRRMKSGQTVNIPVYLELGRENVSSKVVQIKSTKDIAVSAISRRNSSIQTVLVLPTAQLGTKYFIPPEPHTSSTTTADTTTAYTTTADPTAADPNPNPTRPNPNISNQKAAGAAATASSATLAVTERGRFRILIINTDEDNTVTAGGTTLSLSAHQVAQLWLHSDLRGVEAEKPVAVLFGHPCTLRHACTCGQLYVLLRPATEEKLRFLVPPFLAQSSTQLLLLDGSGSTETFDRNSPVYERSGSVLLYQPGLLLPLIPESHFASCYVLNKDPRMTAYAVVVVHKKDVDGVMVNTTAMNNVTWEHLKTTEYQAARYTLQSGKTLIWHAKSKMAVYFIGENGGSLYGHPAAAISTTPDSNGCALVPEVVVIESEPMGWRESLQYCKNKQLELANFYSGFHIEQVQNQVVQKKSEDLRDVWIGMRRSSLNGEWYWASGAAVRDTNWGSNEPGKMVDGQCAIMTVEDGKDFKWRDEDCCKTAVPVCLKKGTYLPL